MTYQEQVVKYLSDCPVGTIKDLNQVKEKDMFIQACKVYINQTGAAEFNSTYTKIRKIKSL